MGKWVYFAALMLTIMSLCMSGYYRDNTACWRALIRLQLIENLELENKETFLVSR